MTPWPWFALAGLGAFHGVNPAMGWLFAVALGLQARSGAAVWRALPPIALGHAASIATALGVLALVGAAIEPALLRVLAALCLLGFGLYRLLHGYRHRARVGMVAGFGDLVLWSFLMASAHGAGLMLAPVALALPVGAVGTGESHHHAAALAAFGGSAWVGLAAVAVHTAAMLAATALIAWTVYAWIGLGVLRSAWINLDLVWSCVLVGAGLIFLILAASSLGWT